MRKLHYILTTCLLSLTMSVAAQKPFHAYLINNEYDVYLRINFYDQDITVPGQELYGQLPGFLGKKHNSFCWIITSAEIKGKTATLSLINDYGSEDLTATLTQKNDSVYVLKQGEGSTLKVPKNGKWQKLPKTLELKRKE
ncbi:MAG: hypothetical protein K6F74_07695 [Prevotella sp.]|nr:hypothetical protein [Prevotella sp.]